MFSNHILFLSIMSTDSPDVVEVYNPYLFFATCFIGVIYLLLVSYPFYVLFKYLFHRRLQIIISLALFYLVFLTISYVSRMPWDPFVNGDYFWEEYMAIAWSYFLTLSFTFTIFFIVYNCVLRFLKKQYSGSILFLIINIVLIFIGYAISQTVIN